MKTSRPSVSQFRDPWGLVKRMLRSRNPAARWALIQHVASLMAIPLDLALARSERRYIQSIQSSPELPIILILGPPRSGTTLIYQVLTRYLDVSFFDNLTSLFSRAPIIGRSLFPAFETKNRGNFESFYGNSAGWRSPNDGFHVWNRWLGDDRYKTPGKLGTSAKSEMKRFFAAWESKFQKPLLNKNNRNTDCVDQLYEALPTAFFIEVRRDPVFIAQSLILAREHIQGDPRLGWGLGSRDLSADANRNDVIDSVCDQVAKILGMLDDYRGRLARNRYLATTYERFCGNPSELIAEIVGTLPNVRRREAVDFESIRQFRMENRQRLPHAEFDRITRRFA